MSISLFVAISIWVVGILSFLLFVPKQLIRKFLIAFFAGQALLWLSSLLHVQLHLLAFPMREFHKATGVLVTTEFFLYPLLFAFILIYEPKRNRLFYRFLCISAAVTIDKLLVTFTHLIEYVHYTWYINWVVFFCIFFLTHLVTTWFFKNQEELRREREAVQ